MLTVSNMLAGSYRWRANCFCERCPEVSGQRGETSLGADGIGPATCSGLSAADVDFVSFQSISWSEPKRSNVRARRTFQSVSYSQIRHLYSAGIVFYLSELKSKEKSSWIFYVGEG